MFNKYQGVFRSRWKALWWSAGILLTAYCTVPDPDGDNAGSVLDLPVKHAKKAPRHDNPWALDPPKDT